jgi:aminoglycoside phosphotransferase
MNNISAKQSQEEDSSSLLKPVVSFPLCLGMERVQCDSWFTWSGSSGDTDKKKSLQRKSTSEYLSELAETDPLENRFDVDWDSPIGEGAFGLVYKAKDRKTGENVAIKAVPRSAEYNTAFQREIDALMYLKEQGGHPCICQLRANYQTGDYYYFVLDLVEGGEMFDHLASHGPYSEADAARLIREIASALAFLHGLHVVHGDLKPENCTSLTDFTEFL